MEWEKEQNRNVNWLKNWIKKKIDVKRFKKTFVGEKFLIGGFEN